MKRSTGSKLWDAYYWAVALTYEIQCSPFETTADKAWMVPSMMLLPEIFIFEIVYLWTNALWRIEIFHSSKRGVVVVVIAMSAVNYFVYWHNKRGERYLIDYLSRPRSERRRIFWISLSAYLLLFGVLSLSVYCSQEFRS